MQSTVQDLGRPGRASLGVPLGGAADPLSLRIGNRLLANPEGAAALEMTLSGGVFTFDRDADVVVIGGEAPVHLGDAPANAALPLRVPAGAFLRIGRIHAGARLYLCVRGGLDVPPVLGSASTLLAAGFGGHDGRALRAGDALDVGPPSSDAPRAALPESWRAELLDARERRTLRALPGAHAPAFRGADRLLYVDEFVVTPQSDRAGLRLQGPVVPSPYAGRMISEGMTVGAVQIPENGQPILLMPDGPTTGGYPVAACIAEVDLPTLAQLPPLARVRFERVTLEEARALWSAREALLAEEFA